MNLKQSIGLLLRILAGGVLIYAGFSKVIAPSAEFAAAIATYHVVPSSLIPPIARAWPWLELLVGTYLFFGYYTRFFAGAAVAMFALFLVFLAVTMGRGINPGSCGCFGVGITLSIHQEALIDGVFLGLTLLLAYLAKEPIPFSADAWISR